MPPPVPPGSPAPTGDHQTARRRRSRFRVVVPLVAAAAGLLMSTAAATSRGTELRGQRDQLPQLVVAQQGRVADLEGQVSRLRGDVEARTQAQAGADVGVADATSAAARLSGPAGLVPVTGPGLTVSLSDAPAQARSRPLPPGVPPPTADDLVVHQQDIQGVVNALWAGGAEAMTIMGQRVVATTAVRCVGNTLLLHGAVYSPPFVVKAIGDPTSLTAALNDASSVQIFRQYVDVYGLVFTMATERSMLLPAYTGSVEVSIRPLP
ncbi:MAG TPA: DUF881 domain-containing protein [Frankiaceae bacterium]|nr:DUF881 domain-containing protein [Frankiaceae bacterium]